MTMYNNIGPILTLQESGNYFTSYEGGDIVVVEKIENQPRRTIAIFDASEDGLKSAEKLCDDLNDGAYESQWDKNTIQIFRFVLLNHFKMTNAQMADFVLKNNWRETYEDALSTVESTKMVFNCKPSEPPSLFDNM